MKNLILLMLLAILVSACSQGGQSKAKFEVTIGGLTSSNGVINNIVITGKSASGKYFAKVSTSGSDAITLALPNEEWHFLAMAWESTNFAGKVRCAVNSTVLNGTDVSVQLSLTNAKCFDGTLNEHPSELVSTNPSFKDTNWRVCRNDLSEFSSASDTCTHSMSVANPRFAPIASIQVGLLGGQKLGVTYVPNNNERMFTGCSAVSNMTGLIHRFPVIKPKYYFPLVAEGFAKTGCDSSTGMIRSFLAEQKIRGMDNSSTISMFARFTDADVCSMAKTQIDDVGIGSTSHPYALCNLTQLKHWQNNFSTFDDAHVALAANLDLLPWIKAGNAGPTPFHSCLKNGSTFQPLGMDYGDCADVTPTPYTGTFHGFGKTIKHVRIDHEVDDIGFFMILGTGGEVAHVVFEKPSVRGGNYVGVALGDGGSGNPLHHITVKDGDVEGDDNVGMIAGSLTQASSEVHASGRVRGQNKVGGLIGDASTIQSASFSGIVTSDSGTKIGGIAGEVSTITEAVQSGLVKGMDIVGGIAGQATALYDTRVNGAVMGTLDSGSGNRHGGIVGTATTVERALFLGSIMSYSSSGGRGSISGDAAPTNSYSIQNFNAATGQTGNSHGVSVKALTANIWSDFCVSTSWDCQDADSDFTADSGDGYDMPRLSFEQDHPCLDSDNTATVSSQISAGRGSALNPIILCHQEQLMQVDSSPSLAYRMEEDISLAYAGSPGKFISGTFSGTFDGNGHWIHGFEDLGLTGGFGFFNVNAGVIKNLNLANHFLTSTGADVSLIGLNDGLVQNVRAYASEVRGTDHIGAIAGTNTGTIRESRVDAGVKVFGTGIVGGVAGSNSGTITNVVVKNSSVGPVSAATDAGFGGIVGYNDGAITLASFAGDMYIGEAVTALGGLVGVNDGGSIQNSVVEVGAALDFQSASSTQVGGLIGSHTPGTTPLANLVNQVLVKHIEANDFATLNLSPTIGLVVSGSIPASIVSFQPLVDYKGYSTTPSAIFSFNSGTGLCSSNYIGFSVALSDGNYIVERPYQSDVPVITMAHVSAPSPHMEFTATDATHCSSYDGSLSFFSVEVAANPLSLASMKTTMGVIDLEAVPYTAQTNAFNAFIKGMKGETLTYTPIWLYEEDEYQLFRLDH